MNVDVVIPALDEERSIGRVVSRIPRPPVREIVVVDNGSRDGTAHAARDAGARVVAEPRRGYGSACLAGLSALAPDTEVVVFIDADGSDEPSMLPQLVDPIVGDRADLVVGSRALGRAERGSLTLQQRVGNAIAARWLTWRFDLPATDLGPFRAIRKSSLDRLAMVDGDYGWTVEMQIKAARAGLRYVELPVPYYRAAGPSKVSGTVRGVVGAAVKIVGLLAVHDLGDVIRRRL
jgi:glycosyltransferase involved in cell wall biosynthesis